MDHEAAIKQLAQVVSEQGGELQALQAALLGVLRVLDADRIASVRENLERGYAVQLGASTNPATTAAYEGLKHLIEQALQVAEARSAGPPASG